MEKQNPKEVFSEGVNDILSKMPPSLITWGTTFIFIILTLVIVFSFIIKYPELIEGEVIVTSIDAPVKLSSNQSRQIKTIYVENQSIVDVGDVLLEFQSTTSLDEIKLLSRTIENIESDLGNDNFKYDYSIESIAIGDKSPYLSQLKRTLVELSTHVELKEAKRKTELIEKKIAYKQEYSLLLKRLVNSVEERTVEEDEIFKIQKKLYEDKVISKTQFMSEKIIYLSKREQIDEFNKALIQNDMSIHEDIVEIDNIVISDRIKVSDMRNSILEILDNLKSFQQEWYQNNTIISPKAGKVNYMRNFYGDEYVVAGDLLFSINNVNSDPVAYCYLPIVGYGRVHEGQKARIKLNNYPFEEFGYLEGTVHLVSETPNEDFYLTVITLDNGGMTHIYKNLNLISETKGLAEIVTTEMRLIDRLFFSLKKLNTEI